MTGFQVDHCRVARDCPGTPTSYVKFCLATRRHGRQASRAGSQGTDERTGAPEDGEEDAQRRGGLTRDGHGGEQRQQPRSGTDAKRATGGQDVTHSQVTRLTPNTRRSRKCSGCARARSFHMLIHTHACEPRGSLVLRHSPTKTRPPGEYSSKRAGVEADGGIGRV